MSRLRISTAGSAEEGGAAVARGREAGGAPGRAAVSGTPGGTRAAPTMDCRTPPGCGQTGGRGRGRTPAAETDFPLEGAARLAAAAAVFAARLVLVERAATRRAHRCRLLRRKPDSGQRGHQRRGPYFAAPRPRAAPSRLPPPPTRGPKRSPLTPEAEAALAALEAKLEAAFRDCDTDASGNISKRELYRALERLGLKASGSEQLAIWNRIDRDHNNVIDWAEFRRAGLALHDLGELRLNAPYPDVHHAGGHHGAFAAGPTHRTLSDEVRVDEASKSLAVLARRGSEELIRGTMRVLMRGNRPAGR